MTWTNDDFRSVFDALQNARAILADGGRGPDARDVVIGDIDDGLQAMIRIAEAVGV